MDFTLTEEQLHWRDIARDFTEKTIKPDVLRRDRLPTAAERVPWDWIRTADKLGLRTLGVSREFGGAGADILTLCVVGEELAVGDLGFAVIMDQCWKMAHLFSDAMTPAQQRQFIPPFVKDPQATLAIAITEPGAGSDHQGYYDSPDIDFQTTAVRDGDHYVINGTKRYVSSGCMAKLYFVVARTDTSKPLRDGGSVFVVPSDTPGFKVASSTRKAASGSRRTERSISRTAGFPPRIFWSVKGWSDASALNSCPEARRKRLQPPWGSVARLTNTPWPMRNSVFRAANGLPNSRPSR